MRFPCAISIFIVLLSIEASQARRLDVGSALDSEEVAVAATGDIMLQVQTAQRTPEALDAHAQSVGSQTGSEKKRIQASPPQEDVELIQSVAKVSAIDPAEAEQPSLLGGVVFAADGSNMQDEQKWIDHANMKK